MLRVPLLERGWSEHRRSAVFLPPKSVHESQSPADSWGVGGYGGGTPSCDGALGKVTGPSGMSEKASPGRWKMPELSCLGGK